MTRELLAQHYAEHTAKPFFGELVDFMSSGPVTAIVIEGVRCIEGFRSLAGPTDPTAAPPGSIRGDLGRDWGQGSTQNIVHGFDSPGSATREIALWFPAVAASGRQKRSTPRWRRARAYLACRRSRVSRSSWARRLGSALSARLVKLTLSARGSERTAA